MKTSKVKKLLRTKSGVEFNEGETVTIDSFEDSPSWIRARSGDKTIVTRAESAYEKFTGFIKQPSMKTLEKWSFDGFAKTIDGCRVEPDGICQHGMPSWLLALSYI